MTTSYKRSVQAIHLKGGVRGENFKDLECGLALLHYAQQPEMKIKPRLLEYARSVVRQRKTVSGGGTTI